MVRPSLRFRTAVGLLAALGLLAGSRAQGAPFLSGAGAGDHFGTSVSWAGDVNGDGLDDFLVGIPGRDTAGPEAGQVQLYLGRMNALPDTPALTINGEAAGDQFGSATCTAGDINKDGYDDFLVGAPGKSAAGVKAGRVYLFLGGATPNGTSDKSWDGDIAQARFGASLAGGFDFNKDARPDFAVGAPGYNGAGLNAGQVRIYLGAAVGLATETYILDADQANWALGQSLDPAGDVNKDGYDDLIAGAPQPFDLNSGRAVIWFGQVSSLLPPSRLLLSGELGADQFGRDVSGAGDVNNDGYDDVLVGAPKYGSDNGAAYLFRGGNPMNAAYDWRAVGPTGGDRMGAALDGGFDWNGDGKPDLAVGEPGANTAASDAGAVAVFYGKTTPATSADTVFAPTPPVSSFEAGDEFGTTVRFAGSLLGGNAAELVAGAPLGDAAAGGEAGYVNLFAKPGVVVPVRLLDFAAVTDVGGGVRLGWHLADAVELAGLRVDAQEGGVVRSVHDGWLPAATESVVDSRGGLGSLYRLIGLDRAGGALTLGEARAVASGLRPALVSAPDRNPFREAVHFTLDGPAARGSITVWDVQGRTVRRLFEGVLAAGPRTFAWDGRDDAGRRAAPGIYLIRVRRGGAVAAIRVVRLP